jgi:hypothetical protein
VLYSIQGEDDKRKQDRLNLIVFLLTTLTLVSVLTDVFQYIDPHNYTDESGDPSLLPLIWTRLWLLTAVIGLILAAVAALLLRRQ